MIRIHIFQYQDGSYCIRWKWHWYGTSRHIHLEQAECLTLVESLLQAASEEYTLEKKHHIKDL